METTDQTSNTPENGQEKEVTPKWVRWWPWGGLVLGVIVCYVAACGFEWEKRDYYWTLPGIILSLSLVFAIVSRAIFFSVTFASVLYATWPFAAILYGRRWPIPDAMD
ncbi:MAG: hypothetical protein PVH19_11930, partial [Planctomycetia bacterium]